MVSLFEWSQKIERCFGYCHVWLQHYFNANKTNNANKTTPRTNCKSIRIVQVLNQNIPPCSVILGLIVAVREEFANQPWKSGRRTLPASSATERSLFNCKKCNFFQLKGSNSWACWNSKALGWSFSRRGKGGEGGGGHTTNFRKLWNFSGRTLMIRGKGNRVLQNSPCRHLGFIGCLNSNYGNRRAFISSPLTAQVITTATFAIVVCNLSIWMSFRRRKRRQLGIAAVRRDSSLAVTLLMVTGFS